MSGNALAIPWLLLLAPAQPVVKYQQVCQMEQQ